MQRRAVVIRTIGDAEIGQAIKEGVAATVIPLNDEELQAVKAENERLKAERGVRQNADNIRWESVAEGLSNQYQVKPHGKVYNAFLLGWALAWMMIFRWYDYLSEWNREQ